MNDLSAPVRFSNLKRIAQSPAHYLYNLTHPQPPTASMRLGSHTHALVLGTTGEWAVYDGARRGKAWEAFELEHAQQEIVTGAEVAPCVSMANAVLRHNEALRLLRDGTNEQTIGWKMLGRECSGTPDVRHRERVVEFKTTRNAQPDQFMRDAKFRGYHAQVAWYLDGVVASGVGTPSEAYIIAVESSPPHPVTVLRLTDNAIEMGRRACRLWLERLIACEAADAWPGYCESTLDFDVERDLELSFGEDPI